MGIWMAWMMSYEILDLYGWDIRCLALLHFSITQANLCKPIIMPSDN